MPRRTRSERVAALELAPGRWERAWMGLRQGGVLLRIGLCVVTAIALCVLIRGWSPPFPYREGFVLTRDFVARAQFDAVDAQATEAARERARRHVRAIYVMDPLVLDRLTSSLVDAVDQVLSAETYEELNLDVWSRFFTPPADGWRISLEESQERFQRFRRALRGDPDLVGFQQRVAAALDPFRETGLLLEKPGQGHREEIVVHRRGESEARRTVPLAEVLVRDDSSLARSLRQELGDEELAERVFDWLRRRMADMRPLLLEEKETREAMDAAAAEIADVVVTYPEGQILARAGRPLEADHIRLLRLEHAAAMAKRPLREQFTRAAGVTLLFLALFALCAVYLYRRESRLLISLGRLAGILGMIVATVVLAAWVSTDPWRAELVPLLLFAQIVAIAYRQELAVLLAPMVSLIVAFAIGHSLSLFLLLVGTMVTAILQLGPIRNRTKLIFVGMWTGIAAAALTLVLAVATNQPTNAALLTIAVLNGVWSLVAGLLMMCLLLPVERAFGVLTDLSLLELADVSHPLLQELVRRAPSTYNHSITVGSIAEAAAEAIGARGLLARVGAYYHDIGKMLKPAYFIENQAPDSNRHESLVPAMSTLVIVAHVKDGSDLARQHRLPRPIIDFIEQHHGTTLIEYFYGRATEKSHSDPNGAEVDESLYRYPGPKPQTKETSVLMLADAVESASRTLIDPAPSRIEGLVRDIADRKLDDGQFDESGLTLRELRTIENSMIKSLIANYHGRVKYPEQKTA